LVKAGDKYYLLEGYDWGAPVIAIANFTSALLAYAAVTTGLFYRDFDWH
jgi:hypothetical protein